MTKIEKVLSDALNEIAEKDGHFKGGIDKNKYGYIKTFANGLELHKCKSCGAYHSGNKDGSKHTCRR